MQVTYTPPAPATSAASSRSRCNEPEPYRIKLIGSAAGGAASAFQADLTQIDFGPWAIGTPSTTQRVKFKNITNATVTIGSLAVRRAGSERVRALGPVQVGHRAARRHELHGRRRLHRLRLGPARGAAGRGGRDGRRSSITVKGTGQSSAGTPEPGTASR
jgi:hypothetical protein